MSPTCRSLGFRAAWEPWFSFHPWHKLHLGWATPTVVTQDGYYDVPTWDATGRGYLLYDHGRGTDDYLLVENRRPGVYDQDVARSNLTADRDIPASNVAVRAVGRPGASMTAYFDVGGPGILVDAYRLDSGTPGALATIPRLRPGEANPITFPVRNTGEATGSFAFTIYDLPPGWSATTQTQTLSPTSRPTPRSWSRRRSLPAPTRSTRCAPSAARLTAR